MGTQLLPHGKGHISPHFSGYVNAHLSNWWALVIAAVKKETGNNIRGCSPRTLHRGLRFWTSLCPNSGILPTGSWEKLSAWLEHSVFEEISVHSGSSCTGQVFLGSSAVCSEFGAVYAAAWRGETDRSPCAKLLNTVRPTSHRNEALGTGLRPWLLLPPTIIVHQVPSRRAITRLTRIGSRTDVHGCGAGRSGTNLDHTRLQAVQTANYTAQTASRSKSVDNSGRAATTPHSSQLPSSLLVICVCVPTITKEVSKINRVRSSYDVSRIVRRLLS